MLERPDELTNLIKAGALKEADRDRDELDQYIAVATASLKDARNASSSANSRYTLAYEGLHTLAIATLVHFGVRPGDQPGHRTVAFQKFCDIQDMDLGTRKIVMDAHQRRNGAIYRSALPPLTHKEAETVIAVLEVALPKAAALIAAR